MKYLLLAFVMTLSFNLFSAENSVPEKQSQRSTLMGLWDTSKFIGASMVNAPAVITSSPPMFGFGATLLVTAALTAPLAHYYFNRNNSSDNK